MAKAGVSETEKAYWVALHAVPGIGTTTLLRSVNFFGSAEAVWKAEYKRLREVVSEAVAASIMGVRQRFEPSEEHHHLQASGVEVMIKSLDTKYPDLLQGSSMAPAVLYVRGEILEPDGVAVAVVGTRRPTSYGRQITEQLAEALAQNQVTIVSGLALGVDAIAHHMAIINKGRTIAVVSGDTRMPTPVSNQAMAEMIVNQKLGAIVSPFSPFKPVTPGQFVARDGVMAGLSLAVLVTEGSADSGALHTADFAKKIGRPVMAVPGPITSTMSAAPTRLLQQGATLVTSIDEINAVLGVIPRGTHERIRSYQQILETIVDPIERSIYGELITTFRSSDELVRSLVLPIEEVNRHLTMLELSGLVKQGGGVWGVTGSR